jgi:hypothetical protein
MDLRTSSNHKVFHTIFLRGVSLDRESSVDCMFLEKNKLAHDIPLKIQVCPSAWWWNLFVQIRGYTKRTAQSLMNCFDYEASQLADQSTFDVATWTVTTQFANYDDFLEQVEAELGSDDETSEDG